MIASQRLEFRKALGHWSSVALFNVKAHPVTFIKALESGYMFRRARARSGAETNSHVVQGGPTMSVGDQPPNVNGFSKKPLLPPTDVVGPHGLLHVDGRVVNKYAPPSPCLIEPFFVI